MHTYADILDGSKGLLTEAILAIGKTNLKYLIVGGWVPYLRNSTRYDHPGTKDVDILFSDGNIEGKIGRAVGAFLDQGFLVSAKHDFQMFKVFNVAGKEVVYHIDLLHPAETKEKPELMVDHFDLGLTENDMTGGKKIQKSIALPSSKFLFNGFSDNYDFEHITSEGHREKITIPLIDWAGLIFSKCKSAQVEKRQRDSYDIFLALKQPGVDETIEKLKKASASIPAVKEIIDSFISFVAQKKDVFAHNLSRYIEEKDADDDANYCLSKMKQISQ